MIQRIQSVYLLLTTILSVLFLSGNIMLFRNEKAEPAVLKIKGLIAENNSADIIAGANSLSVILVLSAALSAAAFASYKNRKLQTKLTIILISSSVAGLILMAYYAYYFAGSLGYHYAFSPGSLIPLAVIVLSVLALVAIRKDEDLVRSYDRLR